MPQGLSLFLVRHAPALTGGRLAGRRDVPAEPVAPAAGDWLRGCLPADGAALVSPALRCRQTAQALGLDAAEPVAALWEQDFGAWEGLAPADLPDLGPLPPEALAAHRPRGGESFLDMAARVQPVFAGLSRDTVVIAHAGTVRAALALAVGPAALSFEVAPLSLTLLRRAGPHWSVVAVNRVAPC